MERSFLFFLLVKLTTQLPFGDIEPEEDLIHPPDTTSMPGLIGLNVSCAYTGMTVRLDFDRPFNGIVYSKGFYDYPNCRYVEENNGQNSYTFIIPNNDCGTLAEPDPNKEGQMANIENILIIQNDVLYQDIWDISRKISCVWSDTIEKLIVFRPFVVDMLDVVNVQIENNKVECWMDIQPGTFPNSTAVDSIVDIGEPMTMLIYVRDDKNIFDISVKDCYAYDGPNFENPETLHLQLTDVDGCPRRTNLINYWQRTYQTGNTGASIIAFNDFAAFKLPERMHVYMTCNVHICIGKCANRCKAEPQEPVSLSVPTGIPPTTFRPYPEITKSVTEGKAYTIPYLPGTAYTTPYLPVRGATPPVYITIPAPQPPSPPSTTRKTTTRPPTSPPPTTTRRTTTRPPPTPPPPAPCGYCRPPPPSTGPLVPCDCPSISITPSRYSFSRSQAADIRVMPSLISRATTKNP